MTTTEPGNGNNGTDDEGARPGPAPVPDENVDEPGEDHTDDDARRDDTGDRPGS